MLIARTAHKSAWNSGDYHAYALLYVRHGEYDAMQACSSRTKKKLKIVCTEKLEEKILINIIQKIFNICTRLHRYYKIYMYYTILVYTAVDHICAYSLYTGIWRRRKIYKISEKCAPSYARYDSHPINIFMVGENGYRYSHTGCPHVSLFGTFQEHISQLLTLQKLNYGPKLTNYSSSGYD